MRERDREREKERKRVSEREREKSGTRGERLCDGCNAARSWHHHFSRGHSCIFTLMFLGDEQRGDAWSA